MDGDDNGDASWFSGPHVSIGCVVFPVFVLVWYRYSKKYCRRFDGCEDGEFEMMQDDDDEYSAMELTDRLVKWINRQNVIRIEDYPFGSLLTEGNKQTSDSQGARSGADCGDCFCDGSEGESSGLFWECIPQTQQRAIELCSTKDALEDSDAPIAASESNDTFNSVVICDARRSIMD
mmetsp:Transcript_21071/g.52236  ORF Transcript_21071/g.52236 Transcript_21071/m.52236 type:complete len:177 (-) Transcript_21071:86-616(-)|eukprot:CAMPEP_0116092490 /NCGR_PEP_ID=MMETSP0327-20121206/8074_1 /TAXON_ID=44447 /ORGANISM="Pseudo-nitzschia delicatissima, Strain B596" /LENGTH=176 /DNA_ID=CAMNT_0003583927 /DNA_START=118 /DNA_END=648 /DNA_ORIENTATION=-